MTAWSNRRSLSRRGTFVVVLFTAIALGLASALMQYFALSRRGRLITQPQVKNQEPDDVAVELTSQPTMSPTKVRQRSSNVLKPSRNSFKYDPSKQYRVLGGGFGRDCNQMLVIAGGLTQAMQDNFTVLISPGYFRVLTVLDLDLFQKTFNGYFEFVHPSAIDQYKPKTVFPAPSYWCSLKTSLPAIRKGFRPNKQFQEYALADVNKIRAEIGPNTDLMSVHVRKYDGICDRALPDSCEWTHNYQFRPEPFGCNQTLSRAFLDWIKSDWPDHPWNERRLAFYLSSDRQDKLVDKSYLEGYKEFNVLKVFEPTTVTGLKYKNEYRPGSEMIQDMWVSVLTDFYVGMPRSSCDKIVAEWRAERASKNDVEDRVHPRQCFGKYFTKDVSDHHSCPHVKYIGLDTSKIASPLESTCNTCELVLALAAVLSKAKRQQMGVHYYGEHGKFIQDFLLVETKDVPFVFFREQTDATIFDRLQPPNSGKFRASAVHGDKQVECARSHILTFLSDGLILPSVKIRQEVERELKHDARLVDTDECKRQSYCHVNSTSTCSNDHSSSSGDLPSEWTTLHKIWARVLADEYVYDPHSPCTQVIALWKRAMKKPVDGNTCCVGGYFLNNVEEPLKVSSIREGNSIPFTHDIEQFWTCP